jgi:uncharacterized membrane protein
MIEYLIMFALSGMPISEVRGALIYGLGVGLNPYVVLLLSILGNILVVPVIFYFFRKAHFRSLAMRLFGKRMADKLDRHRQKFEKWDELALFSFVAIPLPVTGAYTGAFLAELLDLNRRKAFLVISAGIVVAGLIVFSSFSGLSFLI